MHTRPICFLVCVFIGILSHLQYPQNRWKTYETYEII